MEGFEEKLKHAMARTNAPEGFAGRVLTSIARKRLAKGTRGRSAATLWGWFGVPAWRGAFAGVLVVLFALSFLVYRDRQAASQARQERIRGEQTSAELIMALNITGSQLARVRELLVLVSHKKPPTQDIPASNGGH